MPWLGVLALVGCPKGSVPTGDDALPEAVDALDPGATDVSAVLARGSGHVDPAVRARAAALQVEVASPSTLVAVAERALGDEAEGVRRATVQALCPRGEPEARSLLLSVAGDEQADPWLRMMAALCAPGAEAVLIIEAALREERQPGRLAVFALAGARMDVAGADRALDRAVATGELPLDVDFLRELGAAPGEGLIAALRGAQDRAEPEIALALAGARLALGDTTAEVAFRGALTSGSDEARLEAIDQLRYVRSPTASALLQRAANDRSEAVRMYASMALAAAGTGDVRAFANALATPDRELRELSVTLAGTADPTDRRVRREVTQVLAAALSDRDASVRATAARVAGDWRLHDFVPELRSLLRDDAARVQVEAAGALARLDASGPVPDPAVQPNAEP